MPNDAFSGVTRQFTLAANMKLTVAKYLVLGFGLPALFLLSSLGYVSYRTRTQSADFSEAKYQKDYVWNGMEIGTVLRFPVGGVEREKRYYAIVAFQTGQTGRHYLLVIGPNSASPERPRFISATEAAVIYDLPPRGQTNINLTEVFKHNASGPKMVP